MQQCGGSSHRFHYSASLSLSSQPSLYLITFTQALRQTLRSRLMKRDGTDFIRQRPRSPCHIGLLGAGNAQAVGEGYLTLQPFGFGSKSTSPSAGVFVGAMNVTYRTASALPLLRTTCTSPLVSKKPSPALKTLL